MLSTTTNQAEQKAEGIRNRFWNEALEEPHRRRSGAFCALLMLLLEDEKVPEKRKETVARILVRDGDGSIQRRAHELLPKEIEKALIEARRRLEKHSQGAGKNAGLCAD